MKELSSLKIALASDHAGYSLKQTIIAHLQSKGITVYDFGCYTTDSCDYPDYAHPLAKAVADNEYDFGILICYTGNGVCMTANKHTEIRAAVCWEPKLAELARQHNNANILGLPAGFISIETAIQLTDTFLTTDFEGGRHERRINKIPL